MLPRVSAALTQFIAPIASSQGQTQVRPRKEDSFRRFSPQPEKKPEKREEEPAQAEIPSNVVPLRADQLIEPGTGPLSVAHSFIQLLAKFQKQRSTLLRWLGARTYQTVGQTQRKTARFRKGAMLDTRVE